MRATLNIIYPSPLIWGWEAGMSLMRFLFVWLLKLTTNISSKFLLPLVILAFSAISSAKEVNKTIDSDSKVEIIVVTAQKRVENIQEVPISIASFSSDRIEKMALRQLNEVAEFVPNLQMSQSNDFSSSIIIRGVLKYYGGHKGHCSEKIMLQVQLILLPKNLKMNSVPMLEYRLVIMVYGSLA